MDIQVIIVIFIIIGAILYIGNGFRRKAKAFSPKKNCGTNCGCGEKTEGV